MSLKRSVLVLLAVCLGSVFVSPVRADDANEVSLLGNVFRLTVYSTSPGNVVYRAEIRLATLTDDLRTVPFDCEASDRDGVCQSIGDLFPGCTTQTSTTPNGDGPGSFVKQTECVIFDKDAGACIDTKGFHTGVRLESTGLSIVGDGECSEVKD